MMVVVHHTSSLFISQACLTDALRKFLEKVPKDIECLGAVWRLSLTRQQRFGCLLALFLDIMVSWSPFSTQMDQQNLLGLIDRLLSLILSMPLFATKGARISLPVAKFLWSNLSWWEWQKSIRHFLLDKQLSIHSVPSDHASQTHFVRRV